MVRGWRGAAMCGVLWLASATAAAHPGATVQIRDVSAKIHEAPDDVDLRLRRADLYRRAEHFHDALADLRVVARLDPDRHELPLQRALVYAAMGKRKAALRDLDAFLGSGDGTALAYWTRAKLWRDGDDLEGARADYDAAIALGSTPDMYLERAAVDEARDDLDAAATGLAEGCDATTPPIVLQLARVDVERRRGALASALAVVDQLLSTAPTRADWTLTRAEILAELGRADEALADRLRALAFAEAAVASRGSALHRLTRGRVYLALGQTAAARDEFQWVIAHAPHLTEAASLLASAKRASP